MSTMALEKLRKDTRVWKLFIKFFNLEDSASRDIPGTFPNPLFVHVSFLASKPNMKYTFR